MHHRNLAEPPRIRENDGKTLLFLQRDIKVTLAIESCDSLVYSKYVAVYVHDPLYLFSNTCAHFILAIKFVDKDSCVRPNK